MGGTPCTFMVPQWRELMTTFAALAKQAKMSHIYFGKLQVHLIELSYTLAFLK